MRCLGVSLALLTRHDEIMVTFTYHASVRQEQRKISAFLVTIALTQPDRIVRQGKTFGDTRKRYEKTLPDGLTLVVIACPSASSYTVLTAFIRGK